jgi:hypothetical protein
MTNSSIRPSTLVTFSVGIQTPGEPTLLMSGRVFPSVKIASPCSFTGSFIAYFTGSIRLRHCRLNALDQSREARWNVLQTRVRRERHGRRRSCNSSSFNEKQWCPGWESDSVAPLIQRNLLIFRGATNARSATLAQVGYTFGTHNQNFDSWWRPN